MPRSPWPMPDPVRRDVAAWQEMALSDLDIDRKLFPSDLRRRAPGLVMIVDDEPAIVEMLGFLFEDEGYPVVRAFDGEDALSAVERRPPALVISDIHMPRMDGVELARRLQAHPGGAIPAILMSAAFRGDPGAGVAFVEKPFDPCRLLSLALRHLDRR